MVFKVLNSDRKQEQELCHSLRAGEVENEV